MIAWKKKASRAKSIMILALGDSALSQARLIIDDDERNAKDLWG